jgi:hypothetical protein
MSYTPKGLNASTTYRAFALHVGPTASRVKLSGVNTLPGGGMIEYLNPQVLGSHLPRFTAVDKAGGQEVFTTVGIGQLATLGLNFTPYSVTGASGNTLDVYYAAIGSDGKISNVGVKATCTKALLHLQSISGAVRGACAATVTVQPLWDGTNDPWIINDVPDLATAVGDLADEDECWQFAGAAVDSTAITLASGFSFQNLPLVEVPTAGPFPQYAELGEGRMTVTVPVSSPTPFWDLCPSGTSLHALASYGTATDPPVAATSLAVNMARLDPYGRALTVANGGCVLLFNAGAVRGITPSAGAVGRATSGLVFDAFQPGLSAGDAMTLTRNADS